MNTHAYTHTNTGMRTHTELGWRLDNNLNRNTQFLSGRKSGHFDQWPRSNIDQDRNDDMERKHNRSKKKPEEVK